MVDTGVELDHKIGTDFQRLKMRSKTTKGAKLRYIIFNFNADKTLLTVEEAAEEPPEKRNDDQKEYGEFLEKFTSPGQPRLGVYDFPHTGVAGLPTSTIVLLHYNPDSTEDISVKIKDKMMTASSQKKLLASFNNPKYVTGTDPTELDYDTVLNAVTKK